MEAVLQSSFHINTTQNTNGNTGTTPQMPAVVLPTQVDAPRQQQEPPAPNPPSALSVTREETLINTAPTMDASMKYDKERDKYG